MSYIQIISAYKKEQGMVKNALRTAIEKDSQYDSQYDATPVHDAWNINTLSYNCDGIRVNGMGVAPLEPILDKREKILKELDTTSLENFLLKHFKSYYVSPPPSPAPLFYFYNMCTTPRVFFSN